MPRSPRQDFAGAWHHVMNRGIDRAPLFRVDGDYRRFLIELREACGAFRVEVHAYCLLSNHYHLVLHTPQATLSGTMQRMAARYTQAFNRSHQRDGPVFRGRFKSVIVESDAQLTHLTRYVHCNPVQAGLVDRAEAWAWSSAGAYLGVVPRPSWLRTGLILAMFGGSDPQAAYRTFLDSRAGSGPDPAPSRHCARRV